MKGLIIKGIGIIIILLGSILHFNAQTITIKADSVYQTIRGFGGMSHTTWIRDLNADNREKAFGNDPGELGLTILRIHIDPNSSLFYREVPTALYAIDKGAIVFASPWDPPAELLDPNSGSHRIPYDNYDEYVTHLNSFNTYMADSGVSLYAISVQNEPDWAGGWTNWTSDEMITFLGEFGQNINNRIIAPESYQFRRIFTDPILNDANAVANVDIVGGHIYGGGLYDYPLAREKGKEVWMTEHYTSSDRSANLWPDALNVGTEINNCMKANFNAYVWWYIRRFYGLITDDGLISKRGYVMSHYSKFIRPGAVRVDATVASATDLDVTAYKTDTSIVIIVINENTTSQTISFTLQNYSIDTLTKFTTSDTKNVVNDGTYIVSSNTFSADVDAQSVTTFTSYAGDGGKHGNVAPIAKLGDNIVIDDTDGNGKETIMLDGTGSSDQDGVITNYSWSLNETQVAWEPTYELNANIGEHELVLTVTDNDGARHSDTIKITVNTLNTIELWLEAECGRVGSTWNVHTDANASNGKYVMVPAGIQSIEEASSDTADHIVFEFEIEEAGKYKVWGRANTPNYDDDSFWAKMDNGTWARWNGIRASGDNWHWDVLHNDIINDEAIIYDLNSGIHTLTLCYREDGAGLDKLYLTNT
ncbi:MAG: hypothetical protein JXB17_06570, partial [Bacteroidales bacterium]|nr:hypothetical protein [Bacteroidales bacterium]